MGAIWLRAIYLKWPCHPSQFFSSNGLETSTPNDVSCPSGHHMSKTTWHSQIIDTWYYVILYIASIVVFPLEYTRPLFQLYEYSVAADVLLDYEYNHAIDQLPTLSLWQFRTTNLNWLHYTRHLANILSLSTHFASIKTLEKCVFQNWFKLWSHWESSLLIKLSWFTYGMPLEYTVGQTNYKIS